MGKINIYKGILTILLAGTILLPTGCVSGKVNNEKEIIPQTPTAQNNIVVNEEEVINTVNELKQEIINAWNGEDIEQAKETTGTIIISMVDFIYNGKEIQGHTYNELSASAKQEILTTFYEMDRICMLYDPNYKEEIQGAYGITVEWLNSKINSIRAKLGEEKVDLINEKYNQLKEKGGEIVDQTTEYVKNKYETYKNNR